MPGPSCLFASKVPWLTRPEWWNVVANFTTLLSKFNMDSWHPVLGDLPAHVHFIFEGILPCMKAYLDYCWDPELVSQTLTRPQMRIMNDMVSDAAKVCASPIHNGISRGGVDGGIDQGTEIRRHRTRGER